MTERPNPTRTPGTLFFVRYDGYQYQVIPVYEVQGRRMRERGVKYVFDTSTQAYAVMRKMNRALVENETKNLLQKT